MLEQVNRVEYGLTGSVWTTSLANAHRAAARIESGFIWVNHAGPHFMGVSFGGYKQSGIGREEGSDEILGFTQHKNVHIVL
jgi:betaine-aldehyde dehydrogenase